MTPSPEADRVTVVGEATRTALPDVAEVIIGVQTTATTPSQALRDNALRTQHIMQLAAAAGLQQPDVKTLGLNLYPLYPAGGPGAALAGFRLAGAALPGVPDLAQAPAGYRVDNSIKLSIRDAARMGELLDSVVSAGGTLVSNVIFRLRDDAAVRRAVLEAAVQDARGKAEIMAAAMSRQVGQATLGVEDAVVPPEPGQNGGELLYRARVRLVFTFRP